MSNALLCKGFEVYDLVPIGNACSTGYGPQYAYLKAFKHPWMFLNVVQLNELALNLLKDATYA